MKNRYELWLERGDQQLFVGDMKTHSNVPRMDEDFDFRLLEKRFNKQIKRTAKLTKTPCSDITLFGLYNHFANKEYVVTKVKHGLDVVNPLESICYVTATSKD